MEILEHLLVIRRDSNEAVGVFKRTVLYKPKGYDL